MPHLKVLTIIGARPQFIKASVVSKSLSENKNIREIIIHTGQHYDQNMSAIFFEELGLPRPNYQFDINQGTHANQSARMMIAIEEIALQEKPQCMLVYGDTNSTLAGALVGAKLYIPVVHIEAGMRSFDKKMPEEINRIVTDHCSSLLFCPSETAVENLKKEGITKNVFPVGDVMYDTLLFFSERIKESDILNAVNVKKREYVLLTIHRASNTDSESNLIALLDAFKESAVKILFPIHPRTKKKMQEYNLWAMYQDTNLIFIDPVSYGDMLTLEKNAKVIATDSGGVQKEAYYLGVPCITLRDTTEWPETVATGSNILVHTDKKRIISGLRNPPKFYPSKQLYGGGNAAKDIITIIEKHFDQEG